MGVTPPEAEGSDGAQVIGPLPAEDTFLRGRIRKLEGLCPDPLDVFSVIRSQHGAGSFLLESARGKDDRYSIIGYDPLFTFSAKGRRVEVTLPGSRFMPKQRHPRSLRTSSASHIGGYTSNDPWSVSDTSLRTISAVILSNKRCERTTPLL